MNRIDRLTAILIQLQTKRVVKAEEIADRFEISLRTVYRDVKALMEAGVPIGSEAGKGYFIVDGFHLPPVMFSTDEAGALLLASKLVEKMTDRSVRNAFESALMKIKAVLNDSEKDRLESLHAHIEVSKYKCQDQPDFPNHFITDIQRAVVQKQVLRLVYFASYTEQESQRDIEPIGLFHYGAAWHLIGWCRLRNDYRDFRVDRIKNLVDTGKKFDNLNLLSIQQYISQLASAHGELQKVVVFFDKATMRYVGEHKYAYGFVSEQAIGDKVKMVFLTAYPSALARWLFMYGCMVDVEAPETFKTLMINLLLQLNEHYAVPVIHPAKEAIVTAKENP